MQQEPKPQRERAADLMRSLLVPDDWRNWRPTSSQVLSVVRTIFVLVVLLALFSLIAAWLWGVIAHYVDPRTPSDRKDLVNVFVLIGAGVVGLLTATAAVGNLYISRRNLEQQRILEEERAQDDALQAYYKQLGDLLTKHALKKTKPEGDVALLARAQTLTVAGRLDQGRKGQLLLFLYGAGLINKSSTIVKISHADFSGATLSDVNLDKADLSNAYFNRANLDKAYLRGANLSVADLRNAEVTPGQLAACKSLSGATMPKGQRHKD